MSEAAVRRRKEQVGGMPLRLSPRSAARLLDMHRQTLYELIYRDVFTVIAPRGRGIGKRIYLDPREVEVYATGGEDAVREYQARKRRGNGNADSAKGKSPFRNN